MPSTTSDFNNDGIDDYLTLDWQNNTAQVQLGNGDGTFRAGPTFPTQQRWTGAEAVGEFNGDGHLDLVLGGLTADYQGDVRGFLGNGDGSFRPAGSAPIPDGFSGGAQEPYDIQVADLNNDGRLDLAVLGWVSNNSMFWFGDESYLNVLLGKGDGSFSAVDLIPLTQPGDFQGGSGFELGDFNSDGNLDVLASNLIPGGATMSSHLTLRLGRGDGQFEPPAVVAAFEGEELYLTDVGDFNGDGHLDARMQGFYYAERVLLGNGDGTFHEGLVPLSLRISDVSIAEGNAGTTNAVFTVSLSAPSIEPVTVDYSTANGTAAAGSDYQAASGTLTFAPGETTKTLSVAVLGDTLVEPNESFSVQLSNARGATIADGTGVGTIVNDDISPPRIRITDVSRQEGKNGHTAFTFTVTLSAPSTVPVTVNYATADGTATAADNDYVPTSGTLTFAPGETSKTITVQVKGDRKKENNETFFVLLSNAINALLEDDQGLGTILNDD